MNWNTFINQVKQYPSLKLQFQYDGNERVNANYHITEIKQAQITSVDCGGRLDAWTEIVVQLWEPEANNGEAAMEVQKAMKIIDIVESKVTLNPAAEVKFEYGNSAFGTRQLPVSTIEPAGEDLVIHLENDTTQCKASDVCGKPKIQLSELSASRNSCCGTEAACC